MCSYLDGEYFIICCSSRNQIYYSNLLPNIEITVCDFRYSFIKKMAWEVLSNHHLMVLVDGPLEAVQTFIKNQDKQRFAIDPNQEYLFSIHHQSFIKRISF